MNSKSTIMSVRHVIRICLLFLLGFFIFSCSAEKETAGAKIQWETNVQSAFQQAKLNQKPLLIDFMATWCPPCQKMEATTFSDTAVIEKASEFITVRVDVDKQGDLANAFQANARKYDGVGIPNILFMSPDSEKITHVLGYQTPEAMAALMDSVLTII